MARDETELLEMGARIKELREAHGFKQQWIADQIGVTLRTYQFWQAGASPPEQENLEKLALLFGVTPKYILKGETPTPVHDRGPQLDRIENLLNTLMLVTDDQREATAARIRELMAQQCLDQTALARKADLSEKTISRLLNSEMDARYKTLNQIAKALGVTEQELRGIEVTPPAAEIVERLNRIEAQIERLTTVLLSDAVVETVQAELHPPAQPSSRRAGARKPARRKAG